MSDVYTKVPRLIHCFGTEKSIVNIEMVLEMLKESKNNIVPINTHNIDMVSSWEELPIGYGNANWREVSTRINIEGLIPVWNINLQTTAEEVVRRILKATDMGGKKAIKMEVLDEEHKWSKNEEVVKAVRELQGRDLEIWPLIAPDKKTIDELIECGCPMIRLLGSPISSGEGLKNDAIDALKYIKEKYPQTKVMLDGGVGKKEDVYKALINGFDSVLVNSYLYKLDHSPAEELRRIVNIC